MKHFKYNKNYSPLTNDGAEKLVKIIKNSNTEMGILLMKNIHDSFYRALNKRRVFTKYQRPEYTWMIEDYTKGDSLDYANINRRNKELDYTRYSTKSNPHDCCL